MFDHELAESAATFGLAGSSISLLEAAALLGNSPLYGQSSLTLAVKQLPFDAAIGILDARLDVSVGWCRRYVHSRRSANGPHVSTVGS